MLMGPPEASNLGQSPQLPGAFKAPNAKTLQSWPALQKEAQLARFAEAINNIHAEIESRSREFVRAGMCLVPVAQASFGTELTTDFLNHEQRQSRKPAA